MAADNGKILHQISKLVITTTDTFSILVTFQMSLDIACI